VDSKSISSCLALRVDKLAIWAAVSLTKRKSNQEDRVAELINLSPVQENHLILRPLTSNFEQDSS